ncbi:hypothetical protein GW17_00034837 [Ensete ventricosum]|nr:hypothetical protein GW17_00034837 [Ensete ventricosum]
MLGRWSSKFDGDLDILSRTHSKVGRGCIETQVGSLRLWLGSIGDSCKKVKSGEVPDMTPSMMKSVHLSIYDPLLRRST